MNYIRNSIFSIVILIAFSGLSINVKSQTGSKLPRSIPETEGVLSSGIIDFLNAADTSGVELHSFMFIRHGKVIAEGWWSPYAPEYRHLMYSGSKTFTATAIGLAISENRLKLTDKVISFFPYSLPDSISDYMKDLTVQNLLMMSAGQSPEPSSRGINGDWMKFFIGTPPVNKPGTVFLYNNMATFMLSAIVQQVTGQTTFDYLMPRLFKPLDIRGIDWDKNPQGINLGMIGLRLHTEDLGKFGTLLMQKGKWNNQQILPSAWVQEATTFKIATFRPNQQQAAQPTTGPSMADSDWGQGYCYQMWRGKNNTVRLDGMGGQYIVLIPDKDAVVVFTANASNTQKELNLMHNYLIPAIVSEKPLKAEPAVYEELKKREASLSIKSTSVSASRSTLEQNITGREFIMSANSYNVQSVYFSFNNEGCSFILKRDNQLFPVRAGFDRWIISNTVSSSLLAPPGPPPSKSVDANYSIPQSIIKLGAMSSWTDNNTLEITGRHVEENLGAQTIVCKFSQTGGNVRLTIETKGGAQMMGAPGAAPAAAPLSGIMAEVR